MPRYKIQIPPAVYDECGYSPVYCPVDAADWENLHWGRFASGGDAPCRHMFVDDWRLESLWRDQKKGLFKVLPLAVVTSPDFTIETNYPLPLVQYQVWRSSALAYSWQAIGAVVVPVLQWGSPQSFPYCTAGIQKGSVVAVRGPSRGSEDRWRAGAEYMRDHLDPSLVLFFGRKEEADVFTHTIFHTLK
ncbi:MAG: DUF4417 domain-containing protein [Candidatus Electrothrix sp. AW2]|nr:DUF4417 domain-containing protein [Candidatus Electrothrix gigas]